jgi:hypothetical protein
MKPSHLGYFCQVVSMKIGKHQQNILHGILTLKVEVPSVTIMPIYPK